MVFQISVETSSSSKLYEISMLYMFVFFKTLSGHTFSILCGEISSLSSKVMQKLYDVYGWLRRGTNQYECQASSNKGQSGQVATSEQQLWPLATNLLIFLIVRQKNFFFTFLSRKKAKGNKCSRDKQARVRNRWYLHNYNNKDPVC